MRHPEQNLALLLIFAVIGATLYNLFRYFTKVKYADRQDKKIQIFVIISSIHLITACMLLANDIIALYKDYFFMYVWPTEHRYSFQLVIGNLILALLSYGVALLIVHRRLDERWLPGPGSLLRFTILAVAVSIFSVYISLLGYCCETPVAVFAGFPFSYMRGFPLPDNLDDNILQKLSLVDIVRQYGGKLGWYPDLKLLIMDCLFWGSVSTILLMVLNRMFRKYPTYQQRNAG